MSTTTPNLGLVKPELTDVADITAMNPNWDKIDEELGDISQKVEELGDIGDKIEESLGDISPEAIGAVPLERVVYGLSTNIKDYAMTLERGFYALHLAGSSFTGTDLPDANYKYCSAIIYVRIKSDVITIMLLGNDTLPPQFVHCNDGTWGEWSTQSLSLSGGILKGNLDFKKVDNGSSTIYKNHSATADYGLVVRDVDSDGNYNQILMCAKENTLKYRDTTGKTSVLFGGHNTDALANTIKSLIDSGVIEVGGFRSPIKVVASENIVKSTPFTGTGKGKLFLYSSNTSNITIDGKSLGSQKSSAPEVEYEFTESFKVSTESSTTGAIKAVAVFY